MSISPKAALILAAALLVLVGTCSGPGLLGSDFDAAEPRLSGLTIAPPRAFSTPAAWAPARPPDEQPAALSGVAAPQPANSGPPAPLVAATDLGSALDGYLTDLTNGGMFQGTVLVARDGQVLLSKGYGPANAANGAANTPQTRFRLASLSKSFTAGAIMILQARGALNIQDSICGYLDPCPEAWQPISIRHLLTHTSGLPNYTDFGDFDLTEMNPTSPHDLVARFRDLPLNFGPGTLYSYNNSGYTLLALIIERASGMPYEEFLRQAIFGPLGMRDSGVDRNAGAILEGANGYVAVGQEASFLDASTLFGAGCLYSSVEDLYRWDQALYGDTLLPQGLRDEMFTPGMGDYGYGWWITQSNGRLLISHQGNMTGFSNFIARYPSERLTVIVLSNLQGANSPGISAQLAAIVLGG